MSQTNCKGCTCVKNINDDAEFCGRLVRDGDNLSTFGCNRSCPQCGKCKYQVSSTSNGNNGSVSSGNNGSGSSGNNGSASSSGNNGTSAANNGKLNRSEFLEFLKRQQEINSYEDGLYGFVAQNETEENNNLEKLGENLTVSNNFNQNNGMNQDIVMETPFSCVEQDKAVCTIDQGCSWNAESIICEDIKVTFFSAET